VSLLKLWLIVLLSMNWSNPCSCPAILDKTNARALGGCHMRRKRSPAKPSTIFPTTVFGSLISRKVDELIRKLLTALLEVLTVYIRFFSKIRSPLQFRVGLQLRHTPAFD